MVQQPYSLLISLNYYLRFGTVGIGLNLCMTLGSNTLEFNAECAWYDLLWREAVEVLSLTIYTIAQVNLNEVASVFELHQSTDNKIL